MSKVDTHYCNECGQRRPWLYFIGAGPGRPVKIGIAGCVESRLAKLQTGTHEPLKILGRVRGGIRVERDLHKRFREHRLRGEWFAWSDELALLIGSLGDECLHI